MRCLPSDATPHPIAALAVLILVLVRVPRSLSAAGVLELARLDGHESIARLAVGEDGHGYLKSLGAGLISHIAR